MQWLLNNYYLNSGVSFLLYCIVNNIYVNIGHWYRSLLHKHENQENESEGMFDLVLTVSPFFAVLFTDGE